MTSAGDTLQYNLHYSVAQSLHSLYCNGSIHYHNNIQFHILISISSLTQHSKKKSQFIINFKINYYKHMLLDGGRRMAHGDTWQAFVNMVMNL
jgi:hypothetical protein